MKLSAGAQIGSSPWKVIQPLGQGHFGEVWEVEHEVTHKRGACKVLKPVGAGAKGDVIRDKTLKAARLLARATHPGLVEVYDAGFLDTKPQRNWVVMERLRGRELSKILEEEKRIEVDRGLRYVQEAAEAVAVVAAEGVIHRDLKPDNLFVTGEDHMKVLDFDSAHMPRAQSMIGQVMGTPFYMSPEHYQAKELDSRTDVWALGIILYEMLTGTLPFAEQNIGQLAAAVFAKPLPPPPEPLPPDVWALLDRATQKERDARYTDIADFARAIQELRDARAKPATLAAAPRPQSNFEGVDSTQMMTGDLAAELAALDENAPDPLASIDGTQMMTDDLAAELAAIGDKPQPGDVDGTVMLGESIDFGDALPFESPNITPAPHSQAPPPTLTSEQYASLCAECLVRPSDVASIRQRYGLRNATQHQALDAQWRAKFAQDTQARAAHDQRVTQYVHWLQSRS